MVKENTPELLLKENYKCDKKLKKIKIIVLFSTF